MSIYRLSTAVCIYSNRILENYTSNGAKCHGGGGCCGCYPPTQRARIEVVWSLFRVACVVSLCGVHLWCTFGVVLCPGGPECVASRHIAFLYAHWGAGVEVHVYRCPKARVSVVVVAAAVGIGGVAVVIIVVVLGALVRPTFAATGVGVPP